MLNGLLFDSLLDGFPSGFVASVRRQLRGEEDIFSFQFFAVALLIREPRQDRVPQTHAHRDTFEHCQNLCSRLRGPILQHVWFLDHLSDKRQDAFGGWKGPLLSYSLLDKDRLLIAIVRFLSWVI